MRRALLVCAAITFAVACTDNITEPVPERPSVTPGVALSNPTVAFATTTTEDGLSISTDKDDYAPGETVQFTGSGWQPGDVLDIVLTDDPLTHEPHRWSVNVGADGTFQDATYVVDEGDLNVTFTLVATSRATGRSLTVRFTDGNVRVNGTPLGASFKVTVESFGTSQNPNQTCSGTPTATAEASITAVAGNGLNVGGINENQSSRLTADPASSSSGAFVSWNTSTATNPYTPINARTICVPGFQGGGSRDYIANYTAVPDLKITKTASAANFAVGAPASYTLTVQNIGQLATSGTITVTDEFPAGLTIGTITATGWTCAGTTSLSCTRSTSLTNSTTNGANTTTIVVAVTPTAAAVPSVTNIGKVSGGGDVSPANNESTVTTPVNGVVDLKIDKSHSGTEFTRTTQEQYTLSVTNVGSSSTTGTITVRDTLPTGLSVVSATGTGWTCNAASPLVCTRTTALAPTDPASVIAVDVSVAQATANSITNRARVSGGGEAAKSLTICDEANNCDPDEVSVVDANNAPHADAGGPYTGTEGSEITFDGSGSTDPNPGTTLTYDWDFGDGTAHGTGVAPIHKYADNSSYTVKLTVSDGSLTDVASTTATISNVAPKADFAASPTTLNEGSSFTLSLTNPSDPSSADVTAGFTYAFDCGSGSYDPAGNSSTATCPTTDNGNRTVRGKIIDKDDGSTEYTASVTVANVRPTATFAAPSPVDEGTPIALSFTNPIDPSSADVAAGFHYAFDCGSGSGYGTAVSYATSGSSSTASCPTTDNGTRTVKGKIFDKDNGTTEYTAEVEIKNVDPVADAGGGPAKAYQGIEGSATQLDGSATDVGSGDTFTWAWVYAQGTVPLDAGASCSFDNINAQKPKITCTDDGTVKLTLTVTDDDGGSDTDEASLTVANADPIVDAGESYSGNEGASVQLDGSADDPGNNDDLGLMYLWTSSAPSTCTFDAATSKTAKVTCIDNGSFTLTLTVKDDDGGTGTNTAPLTVTNVAPVITSLTVAPTVVQIGYPVTLNATFTDDGKGDTHTASINWEAVTKPGVVTETSGSGSGSVTGTHSYTATGIYTVTLTVTDDEGASDTEAYPQYVVVYDPSAGFVTGGGWINSQAGAYRLDPTLTGKANFGFVSKYQKGANTPTGNTEFQFHAGSLNFSSTVYEWLVVQGQSKASYKGSGTVNGASGYGFLLSVIDNGSSGDKFRMKIWNKTTGAVVYDNQYGADDEASAAQTTAGGSIVIHTTGGVASK